MTDDRSKTVELEAEASLPGFARIAAELLEAGDHAYAFKLCQEGVQRFPGYATGYLMLGKCYQAAGRRIEAILEFRRVHMMYPDNRWIQELQARVEAVEEAEFAAYLETHPRSRVPRGQTAPDGTVSLDPSEGPPSEEGAKEDSVEFLMRRLNDVRRGAPGEDQPLPDETEHVSGTGFQIVTPTLAEIYAAQGEYEEAVRLYRTLIAQRPAEREKYEARIRELKERARSGGANGPPGGDTAEDPD